MANRRGGDSPHRPEGGGQGSDQHSSMSARDSSLIGMGINPQNRERRQIQREAHEFGRELENDIRRRNDPVNQQIDNLFLRGNEFLQEEHNREQHPQQRDTIITAATATSFAGSLARKAMHLVGESRYGEATLASLGATGAALTAKEAYKTLDKIAEQDNLNRPHRERAQAITQRDRERTQASA